MKQIEARMKNLNLCLDNSVKDMSGLGDQCQIAERPFAKWLLLQWE